MQAAATGDSQNKRFSFWRQPATWAGIVVYILVCLYVFRDFLLAGGPRIASLGGDTVKNTFSFLWQAAYGKGFWFWGMNYPFGEHISFADGQPLVALPLSWLNSIFHLSQPQLLYAMYVAVALSFVVGMVYTQRLLAYFGVHPAWAILFSALILVMSPHTFRYTGHYPLAYAVFLPMLFYWSVRYYETDRTNYLIKIFFLFFAYAFLHLYFLAMGLLWALAYAVGAWLFRRGKTGRPFWHGLRYLVPTFGAFISAELIFKLTDPVKDRPVFPYIESYSNYGGLDLLTSTYSPIWQGAKDIGLVGHIHESSEGFCYLGLVPVAMLLLFAILAATGFWKKISAGARRFELQWLFISLGTLCFSVTIKYIWEEGVFNKLLSPLRQFRAPERFSWIAYYVLSILAVLVLYRLCHYWWTHQRKAAAGVLGFLVTALWAIDANGAIIYFHKANANAAWHGSYFFGQQDSWKNHLAQKGYQPRDFQAMLALPFVHVGSEKIWLNENASYCTTPAFKAALELHLPVMDVNMSRSSWSQAFEAVRLAGGYYAQQTLLALLPDERPILLFHFQPDPISPDEALLLQPTVADSLGMIDDCRLFAFWPKKFLALQAAEKQKAAALAGNMPVGDTILNPPALPVYINHLEGGQSSYGFAGRGMAPIQVKDSVLAVLQLPAPMAAWTWYEFSAWSQFPAIGPRSNYYQIKCYNSEGIALAVIDALGKYSTDNAPGMWFRVSKYFELPQFTARVEIVVVNPDLAGYLGMDELLLRPAAATVITKMPDGKVLVNNHLLHR